MKKISLLLAFVSLSLTAAAANFSDERVINLGRFEVQTSRFSDAEKSIEASLSELRAQARPTRVSTELPSLGTIARQEAAAEQPAQLIAAKRLVQRDARS